MKPLTIRTFYILFLLIFSNCSSAQKLQNNPPFEFGNVYYQKWVSGVKDGGSGINLFIPTKAKNQSSFKLDSVYFRGRAAKLEVVENETLTYVGRFRTDFNQKSDMVMSNDPKEEYGNKLPISLHKILFEIKDSECVVSYKEDNETKYFKIEKISEKPVLNYPSAPPKKQD